MATDERSGSPLLTKKSRIDLDSSDIILPPLQAASQRAEERSAKYGFRWRCVLATTAAVLATAILLCVAIAALSSSSSSSRRGTRPREGNHADGDGELDESTPLRDGDEDDGERRYPSDFRRDLRRHYDRIMDEHEPEDLKAIFDEYWAEASEGSFADFVVTLGSDRLDAYAGRLADADVAYATNATKALRDWYGYLHEVTSRLTDYATQKQLANLTGRSNKELFIAMPRVKMNSRQSQEISEVYKEWLKPMEVKTRRTGLVFAKKIVLLSEVSKMLATQLYFLGGTLFVFASHTLYLDADLHLPQTNLALVAPRWVFTGNATIVLSGLNAIEHANDTAEPGADGMPGRRGGDGGNFFAVGDLDERYLRVYSDGGKGGNGQNGADGRVGIVADGSGNSTDCRQPLHDRDQQNKYGELISYYKVFNAAGCGGDGRDGGVAGEGGRGGRVAYVDTRAGEARIRDGKSGARGRPGKGGAPGRGAPRGCFYYASGVDGRDLESISGPVCGEGVMPSGRKGRDNYVAGEEEAEVDAADLAQDALREYRFFARREYLNGDVAIGRFLAALDDVSRLFGGTPLRELLDELRCVDESGKVEFYESLERRIEFAVEHADDEERRTLLRHLLAVSHGKMTNAKHGTANYVVFDVTKYLDAMWEDAKASAVREERTIPALSKILAGKIEYLNGRFDRWAEKAREAVRGRDAASAEERSGDAAGARIDGRKMARLTLLAAEAVRPVCAAALAFLSQTRVSTEEAREAVAEYDASRNETATPLRETTTTGSESVVGRFERNPGMYGGAVDEARVARGRFRRREERFLNELRLLARGRQTLSEVKTHLARLSRSMKIMNRLLPAERDVADFPMELANLEATLDVVDVVRDKLRLARELEEARGAELGEGEMYDEARSMRKAMDDIIVNARYKDAVNAFRQWVFPHMYVYGSRLPKGEVVTVEEARSGIKAMRKWAKEYGSTIASYDKYVREAVFESNNSVGEFFRWRNEDVRSELGELFRGREIALAANVENEHAFAKSVIKFRTVRIEFQMRNGSGDELRGLLNGVDVDMKHSGFSYYYHDGRVRVHASEGFELRYSYEQASAGGPVKCNMIYKKLMDAPPVFSPYTTWTVQLRPASTARSLLKFADKVDVVLVGSGSFVEVNYDDS